MMREDDVLERLRRMATTPEARGLLDDVAVLDGLIITHDSIAEGVHFLSTDPPASVGWKLVAVNLSDLAAKGATPSAALLSLTIASPGWWEEEFLDGVDAACEAYALPLIGGDTIALTDGAPRVLGMTAIGRAGERIPGRTDARPGDGLWLIGTVGESAAGLAQLRQDSDASGPLVDIYHRPVPQLGAGQAIAPYAHAMMDVSDGLLLDARRMAQASRCVVEIDVDRVPLSSAFVGVRGDGADARLFAATGGDDYALLLALPAEFDPSTIYLPEGTSITQIGNVSSGVPDLTITCGGEPMPLPESLGFEHSADQHRGVSAAPVADRP